MFEAFSEIDKKTEIRVLISWKGRVLMEKDQRQKKNQNMNKVYSYFSNIIHANPQTISTFKLRMFLIKVINLEKPIHKKIENFCTHIVSKKFGISEIDREKVIKSWNMRTKLEKNRKYMYSDEINDVYQHLSNVLHGDVEKHTLDYVNSCEKKIDEFFKSIKKIPVYKLKKYQTDLQFKNVHNIRNTKAFRSKKAQQSKIFFFKSTFSNRRIAIIENDINQIKKLSNNKYLTLKQKAREIGIFEYVDSANVIDFMKISKPKNKVHYQLYSY